MVPPAPANAPRTVGRYGLHVELASGGMGSVWLGRLAGPAGFGRNVAVKCLHPHLARDPEFVAMFLDEARLAARVVHPNVVPTIDVVATDGELFVVMEYIAGETLAKLIKAAGPEGGRVPAPIAVAIAVNVLLGLHAAHETKNERGESLGIVHRDVSPQNVVVGVDGVARVLDFGIAKAADRLQTTGEGRIKGKITYMAPEQLRGEDVNRQADVYAASVVLWEMLTGRRLFRGKDEGATIDAILFGVAPAPSTIAPEVPKALDSIVLKGLATSRTARFATAREMALALQDALAPAPVHVVGEWVERVGEETLGKRARQVAEMEASASDATPEARALLAGLTARGAEPTASAATPATAPTPASNGATTDGEGSRTLASVSARVPASSRRRARWPWFALAGALGAVGAWALWGRAASQPAAISDVRDGASAEASKPLNAPLPSTSANATAIATQAGSAAPIASPSSAPSPATPSEPSPRPPRTTGPPATPKPKAPSCDPPYTRSADGVKVYKRECL